jgi:c(7)-type cytochrome triheme protein
MVCHQTVAKDAEAIQRLAALAKDTNIVPGKPVYTLPDFVFFSHARHKQKVSCNACHGNVWSSETVKLELSMKMKACVDCHKSNRATVACTACHELSQ